MYHLRRLLQLPLLLRLVRLFRPLIQPMLQLLRLQLLLLEEHQRSSQLFGYRWIWLHFEDKLHNHVLQLIHRVGPH
jgi:hypothetical protein